MPETDPTSGDGAVFLSYASQDAAAARLLSDALQLAGVEVWFDQSELRGGDAWDAKLRRQIRECALFMPIISANTQRRKEGYFRLEWRLADQRTHLMGRDRAFLLPVCVDDTRDADADVPDSFLGVQWTRLPGGGPTPAFVSRVRTLLAHVGESATIAAASRRSGPGTAAISTVRRRRRLPSWTIAALVLALGAAGVAVLHERRAAPPTEEALPPEAAGLIEKARAVLANLNYRRSDLELAEGYMAHATDLVPDSAEAWALRGRIQATYVQRTWDYGDARLRDAQAFCNHALALDRKNTEAMWGLAIILEYQGAFGQEEALMRQAMQINPNDPKLIRLLGTGLFLSGRRAEGISTERESVRLFPNDPLSSYDLGMLTSYIGDLRGALEAYREAAAKGGQFSGAHTASARILEEEGDGQGAQAELDQVLVENRSDDRAVSMQMWAGIISRQPERAIEAGGLTASDYLDDSDYRGPKAYLLALAYRIEKKQALADEQWDEGIRVMRERLEKQPSNQDRLNLAIGLAWRGAKADAEAIADPIEAEQREMAGETTAPVFRRSVDLPYSTMLYCASIGDGAKTVFYLKALQRRISSLRAKELEVNPWYDQVRLTPEFQTFVADQARREATP